MGKWVEERRCSSATLEIPFWACSIADLVGHSEKCADDLTTKIQAWMGGLGVDISLVSGLLVSLQTQATKHVFTSTIVLTFIQVS
jgi:hypothetical protein